ncbi:hypothetical protein [Microbacterium suwonense]|nr:hypothetical protein [Microbacterium suwonense]
MTAIARFQVAMDAVSSRAASVQVAMDAVVSSSKRPKVRPEQQEAGG